MNRKMIAPIHIFVCGMLMCALSHASEKKVGGVAVPLQLQTPVQMLNLNGTGIRSKWTLRIYVAGLYLAAPEKNAETIVTADKPMALRLHIVSGMVSSDDMITAIREGFVRSTKGNTLPLQTEIDAFIQAFADKITKDDVFELVYDPSAGTHVSKNGTRINTVGGIAFKRALWGIWLGAEPVQSELKKGLLGGK